MPISEFKGTHNGIDVWEKFDSRDATSGKNNSITLKMMAQGTAEESEAIIAVQAITPLFYFGMKRADTSSKRAGLYLWECDCSYSDPDKQEKEPHPPGTGTFNFDTGGGTTHVSTALEQTGYALSGTPSDFKKAIGVSGEGANQKVEGVDIVVPSLKLVWDQTFSGSVIGLAYVKTLARLTGKVNSESFYGFAAGELLFLGASGTRRPETETEPDGVWDITYNFDAQENRTSAFDVGGISVASKLGHDYLWVRFQSDSDASSNRMVQKPIEAFVSKVYESADFSALQIGG